MKETDATRPVNVTTPIVGGSGASATTNAFEVADGGPTPTAFVAVTVQVYVSPFVSPNTRMGCSVSDAEFVAPPSDDTQVAVNPVIGLPPSSAGAENGTAANEPPW